MKITEVRNNLFGLEDLKGLINENMFDEDGLGRAGLDWGGYFNSNPERLKLNFLQAMGLPKAPTTPLSIEQFESMGGGESEIRKYFGDEQFASILSNPINFIRDKGVKNTYDKRLKDYRKKLKINQEPSKVQVLDILRDLFNKNGGNSIAPQAEPNSEYFERIMNVARKAIMEAFSSGFKDFSETYTNESGEKITVDVGNIYDPFLFFLYLYYKLYFSAGSGTANYIRAKAEEYENRVNSRYPEYAEIIAWVLKQLSGGKSNNEIASESLIQLVVETFLEPLGLYFMSKMNAEAAQKIYDNGRLYDVLLNYGQTFRGKFNVKTLAKYKNTVGGFILKVLYVFMMTPSAPIEEVKALFWKYIPEKEYDFIRSCTYRARFVALYNNGRENVINKLIEPILNAFKASNVNDIFDFSRPVSKLALRNAILETKRNGMAFSDFANVEIPDFEDEDNLTPFEAFILFTKQATELLSENAVKYYGGSDIINEENLYRTAGEGLDILNGAENKPGDMKKRRQRLEDIYNDEENADEWTFYDLLAKDYFGGDKTQRAIYHFLRANTNPEIKWIYEYNRKTQEDKELNPKSIDILCEYGSKKAAFEYQGEQHFRPQGVTPKDEIENAEESPNVKLFNSLKNEIFKEYLKQHKSGKWEVEEIYNPIFLEAYENSFKELVGLPFMDVYKGEMSRSGYLSSLPAYRNLISESARDRQRDVTDIIRYTFCLLCRWHGLKLPAKFQNTTVSENVFKRPKLKTDAVYLGSPWRFKQELHVYFGKISDKEKADLIKKRGWAAAYILPPEGRVSGADFTFTKTLANPSNAVFTWTDGDKQNILNFAEEIGIPVIKREEERPTDLFEQIVKETLRNYNLQ